MKGSGSSVPETRDSISSTREDAPFQKRARGRPLKGVGQSVIPEERRQQVRNAQNAFRQRRQAAMKSLEKRAEVLEDAVEEISKVFLDFSDSMLKTQAIQRDPAIGRNLHSTTAKIIELAKVASTASHTSSGTSSGHEEEQQQEQEEKENTSKPKKGSIILHPSTPTESPPLPRAISNITTLFGNGWFGYEPPNSRAHISNPDLPIPPSGFGLKLITQSLQVTYFALLDSTGIYDELLAQMLKYAYLYHTRDEILANLRWFLEHGVPAQRYLGRAVFGFDSTLLVTRRDVGHVYPGFKPRVLHPLVDAQALLDAEAYGGYGYLDPDPAVAVAPPFLNAFDVEEYLVERGAFHIDDEVIYMQQSSKMMGDGEWVVGDDLPRGSTAQVRNETIVSMNIGGYVHADSWTSTDPIVPPTSSKPVVIPSSSPTNSGLKHCELFDFNALLKDRDDQCIMKDDPVPEKKADSPNKIISLSVPLLLDNLVRNSVCLGTGPGYPRGSIHVAIEASTHFLTRDS